MIQIKFLSKFFTMVDLTIKNFPILFLIHFTFRPPSLWGNSRSSANFSFWVWWFVCTNLVNSVAKHILVLFYIVLSFILFWENKMSHSCIISRYFLILLHRKLCISSRYIITLYTNDTNNTGFHYWSHYFANEIENEISILWVTLIFFLMIICKKVQVCWGFVGIVDELENSLVDEKFILLILKPF